MRARAWQWMLRLSDPDATRARAERLWHELATPLGGWFARRAPVGEVDDLLQETFLRVQRGLPTLREDERVAGWIQRIARNVWIDARRRPLAASVESITDEPLEEPDPGAQLTSEVASWLVAAIAELEELDRAILERTELRGLAHKVVAHELGVSLDVVKARVRRGRAKLKRRLEDCCTFEFDARGGLAGWRKKSAGDCGCP